MGKIQDRRLVVETIMRAASLYKNNLIGNAYLYIFDDRFIEVIYRARDFLHCFKNLEKQSIVERLRME